MHAYTQVHTITSYTEGGHFTAHNVVPSQAQTGWLTRGSG